MIVSDSPSFIIKSSDKIKTKPEYVKYAYDLYPLKKDEYDSLKADIAANGRIYTPLSINKEGIILDGHHRFKIGLEVGIKEFPVIVQEFKDPLDELAFVIKINVLCRQENSHKICRSDHSNTSFIFFSLLLFFCCCKKLISFAAFVPFLYYIHPGWRLIEITITTAGIRILLGAFL